jgi:hypothetical protein
MSTQETIGAPTTKTNIVTVAAISKVIPSQMLKSRQRASLISIQFK